MRPRAMPQALQYNEPDAPSNPCDITPKFGFQISNFRSQTSQPSQLADLVALTSVTTRKIASIRERVANIHFCGPVARDRNGIDVWGSLFRSITIWLEVGCSLTAHDREQRRAYNRSSKQCS